MSRSAGTVMYETGNLHGEMAACYINIRPNINGRYW